MLGLQAWATTPIPGYVLTYSILITATIDFQVVFGRFTELTCLFWGHTACREPSGTRVQILHSHIHMLQWEGYQKAWQGGLPGEGNHCASLLCQLLHADPGMPPPLLEFSFS